MKKSWRITQIKDSVPPIYKLEEGTKSNRGRNKEKVRWQIVCLAFDKEILLGVRNDIIRQTTEKRNGLRKQS